MMKRQKRITLSSVFFLFLCLLNLYAHQTLAEKALEKVTIQLNSSHGFRFAGYYAAIEQGYYAEKGLDVELVEAAQTKASKKVLSGDTLYGVSDASLFFEYLKKKQLAIVLQVFQKASNAYAVKRESDIFSFNDFNNKKIAYDKRDSINTLILKNSTKEAVKVAINTSSTNDFISGRLDAIPVDFIEDRHTLLKKRNLDVRFVFPSSHNVGVYGDNLFTTTLEINKHPERVAALREASIKGWKYALEHPSKIINLIIEKYDSNAVLESLLYEAEAVDELIANDVVAIGSVDIKKFEHLLPLDRSERPPGVKDSTQGFLYTPSSSISGIAFTRKEKKWIANHPEIRMAGSADWPPFDYVDSQGIHKGMVDDYAKIFEQKTGIKIVTEVDGFSKSMEKLKKGEIDLIGGITKSKEREGAFNYSSSFLNLSTYFFIRDDLDVKAIEDLNGKTVAIPEGFSTETLLKESFPEIKIAKFADLYGAIDAVVAGRADMLYDFYPVLRFSLLSMGVNSIVPFKSTRKLNNRPLYFASRKNAPELTSIVNKVFKSISSKERQKITNKWLVYFPKEKTLMNLTEEERKWLRKNKVVRYGVERDWAPFNFVDGSDRHKGISKDFLDEISEITGLKFVPVVDEWKKILRGVKDGQVDLVPAILHTKKRDSYLKYTDPYVFNVPYFFVRNDLNINFLKDLDEKTAAIPKGYIYGRMLRKYYPKINIIETSSLKEAVNLVASNKADMLVDSYSGLSYFLNKEGIGNITSFKPVSANLANNIYMAAPFRHATLASIIDKAIKAIPPSKKQAIFDNWLGRFNGRANDHLILTPNELAWLKAHPVIRYSGVMGGLPFEGLDSDGRMSGIIIDYLELIGKRLNLSFEKTIADRMQDAERRVVDKKTDMASVFLPVSDDGFEKTDVYLSNPLVILSKGSLQYIDDMSELEGKSIGIVGGHNYIKKIKYDYPDLMFEEVTDIKSGLIDLSTGKFDVFIASLAASTYHMTDLGLNQISIIGKTEFSKDIAFSVRDDYLPLVDILNKTIANIDPKEKRQLLDSWGHSSVASKIDYTLLMQVIGFSLVIILFFWWWNYKLSKEITKRTESERNLELLNQRFKLASEAVSFGVWELFFENRKSEPELTFDDNMRQMYSVEPNQDISWSMWLDKFSEEDQETFQSAIEDALSNGDRQEVELHLKDREDAVIYCGLSLSSSHLYELRVVGINWDISQIKETEKQLEKARSNAVNANRAKSEFLANMSHEIRTPMNAIMGFTELLDEQVKDKRLRSFVETIRSAGKSLLSLINDILDLSKVEAGKLEILKSPTDINKLVSDVANIFTMRVRERNLDLVVSVDETIPCALNVDNIRVRQILLNLVGNAVKFTEAGSIHVRVKAVNEDDIRSRVDLVVEVEDTGIGIAEDQQAKIFGEFEQTAGQDAGKYGGTGLGLTISQRLASMMGGEITLASKEGAGSTFTLHLYSVDVASISDVSSVQVDNKPASTFDFDEANVLVVDDVEENRELILHNFEHTNINISMAENGADAVALVKEHDINLIFMDIRMPVMDGYEAAHLIKAFSDVPIVALTASVMQDEMEKLEEKDFDACLRKPVLRAELFGTAAKFLKHKLIEPEDSGRSDQPYVLNEQEKTVARTRVLQLNELVDECAELAKSNDIAQIQTFVNRIETINAKEPVGAVTAFISQLTSDLESFNIVGIKSALNHFENMITSIEKQL